ncbi:MAG TPA: F0F1 ATP synthase subunit A [Myxococcota bacterium]|nr:F0F1 ATP synthase subunit A [Myxococcota bacterium]
MTLASLATPEAVSTFVRVALAVALLVIAGFAVRSRLATAGGGVVPDEGLSVRNVIEILVEGLTSLAKQTMGPEWRRWFPIVGTMFLFILVANLLGLIPGVGGVTTDVNVAGAWAIISYVLFNYVGIREHGLGNYLIKYMGPSFYTWHVGGRHIHVRPLFWLFFPLETILDAARMATLTIRLIANMFADHAVVGVFLAMVPFGVPAIFLGLGLLVCVLQAFVFSLLTMIYINLALQEAH